MRAMGRDTNRANKYTKCMNLAGQGTRLIRAEGYAMAALLVGLSVMSVLMTMAIPTWTHMVKREKEAELIWRGQQYALAVTLFQRKYANTFPPTLDLLVQQKFLRKKYKDPITNDDFQLIPVGRIAQAIQPPGQNNPSTPGGRDGATTATAPAPFAVAQGSPTSLGTGSPPNLGIQGVVSKSKDTSIKIYNGRQKYNEWAFVAVQTVQAVGSQFPGNVPGGRGPGFGPGGGPQGRGPGGRGFQPMGPGGRPAVPFGQPTPSGQPNPFQPPPPFGDPRFNQPNQPRQPNQPGQPPFGASPFGFPQPPPRQPQRPPGN